MQTVLTLYNANAIKTLLEALPCTWTCASHIYIYIKCMCVHIHIEAGDYSSIKPGQKRNTSAVHLICTESWILY